MRVFVAGGAGYVGSFCVKRLLDAGHDVTVFDNLEYGHRAAVDSRAKFVEGDLADSAAIKAALVGGFDAALHFAAYLNVGESVTNPLKYYRNNVTNTIHLLEELKLANVRRLVFSSTCATYGEPEELPITEDLPQHPINPYGHTKLAIEWLLRDCATAWGLGSVALRYFNAAGAAEDGSLGEDHDPEIHLIPLVLQVALGRREKIKVFGTDYATPDGTCVRDYVHVEDLAEAHLRALERLRDGAAEAYNVGTGRGTSVLELISAAREVTGHAIPSEATARRPGDPPALYADPAKIMQKLHWQPRYTDIKRIVATAWAWHSRHPDGYRTSKNS